MSFLSFIKSRWVPASSIILTSAALLLAVLLLISLIGVSSLASSSIAEEPEPFQQAQGQESFYHWYNRTTEIQKAGYQAHVDRMDNQFQLHSREVDNQLQVMINLPATTPTSSPYTSCDDDCPLLDDVINALTDDTIDFRLRDDYFFYNTVRQPQDCNNRLFTKHYNMIVADPETSMLLPLSASDYGRYYCFKVGVRVSKPSFDLFPWKIFVAEQPVQSPGHGDVLANFPNFSHTVMQSTYYHYSFNRGGNDANPNPARENYYRHLNDNFNLYARQASGRFHLRVSLPGHFSMPGRDINDFEIEKMEYKILQNKTGCDRPAFEDGAIELDQLTTSFSLLPENSQHGRFYCLKVSLKGERSWSRDVHPYRIFLIPQSIDSGSTPPNTHTPWWHSRVL